MTACTPGAVGETGNPPALEQENCSNLLDDDGDGAGDCADPDCAGSPGCTTPAFTEDCANGVDDDGDGLVDCADPSCAADPTCDTGTGPSAETSCSNGVDDDHDTLVDCADPDCAGDPACDTGGTILLESDCTDGVDDDLDGAIDCADSDCALLAICAPPEGVCFDGLDDDGDGAIDCLDADCAADAACVPGVCPELFAGPAPAVVAGDTVGKLDDGRGSCDLSPGAPSPDVTVEFTATSTARYGFTLDSAATDFDAVLYVDDGCAGPELGCDDASGIGNGGGEVVVVSLTAGQTVSAVVDGYGGDSGSFQLDIAEAAASETDCADGVDEDFDEAVDCADGDCDADPGCAEDCANRADDDGDGLVDCNDTFCGTDATCAAACAQEVVAAVPFNAIGTTLGEVDDFTPAPSCSSGSTAADYTFEFTAPADGSYTFSLAGSSYDTVLYVLDGCGGPELACNDDFVGSQSEVVVSLTAGQTVVAVVDGSQADAGSFAIDIH